MALSATGPPPSERVQLDRAISCVRPSVRPASPSRAACRPSSRPSMRASVRPGLCEPAVTSRPCGEQWPSSQRREQTSWKRGCSCRRVVLCASPSRPSFACPRPCVGQRTSASACGRVQGNRWSTRRLVSSRVQGRRTRLPFAPRRWPAAVHGHPPVPVDASDRSSLSLLVVAGIR